MLNLKSTATTLTVAATIATLALSTGGCREQDITLAEATQALEEAGMSAEASNLMGSSIEISTSFTIGGALEAAADEVRSYVQSQLPCAEITLQNATLEIEYGALPGNCTYRGHNYSGSHSITVSKNDNDEVVVMHVWDALSNGVMEVSGDATVTWNGNDATRHIVHELEWKRLFDGRTGTGTGDRLQKALPGGIAVGFQEDGERQWQGQAGTWDLAIDGVQMRWADPVPQAGSYTLNTADDKTMKLSFERLDEDTIKVTIAGGTKSFEFDVRKAGQVGS